MVFTHSVRPIRPYPSPTSTHEESNADPTSLAQLFTCLTNRKHPALGEEWLECLDRPDRPALRVIALMHRTASAAAPVADLKRDIDAQLSNEASATPSTLIRLDTAIARLHAQNAEFASFESAIPSNWKYDTYTPATFPDPIPAWCKTFTYPTMHRYSNFAIAIGWATFRATRIWLLQGLLDALALRDDATMHDYFSFSELTARPTSTFVALAAAGSPHHSYQRPWSEVLDADPLRPPLEVEMQTRPPAQQGVADAIVRDVDGICASVMSFMTVDVNGLRSPGCVDDVCGARGFKLGFPLRTAYTACWALGLEERRSWLGGVIKWTSVELAGEM